ncbi:hypothetical protein [Sporolactobacillus terrae]|uniref:hypothetical protein n=1 Tax=Sporolactobacillus terrae TaxID=269673 RepID=UPI00111886AA|nr:hypothetical protein [Sporolactobacillus terrae]
MKQGKVAIIKQGKDIGRIIPFNIDSEKSDFKISFSKNDYSIDLYSFLSKTPEKIQLDNMTEWEISYPKSTGLKPPVIRLWVSSYSIIAYLEISPSPKKIVGVALNQCLFSEQ